MNTLLVELWLFYHSCLSTSPRRLSENALLPKPFVIDRK